MNLSDIEELENFLYDYRYSGREISEDEVAALERIIDKITESEEFEKIIGEG